MAICLKCGDNSESTVTNPVINNDDFSLEKYPSLEVYPLIPCDRPHNSNVDEMKGLRTDRHDNQKVQ